MLVQGTENAVNALHITDEMESFLRVSFQKQQRNHMTVHLKN